jgi:translation initiation factor IF-1
LRRTAHRKKEVLVEFDGVITELLPEGRFRVRLENDHEILAYTAGRMKKNRIRSLVGDRVVVEMTPYDMNRGRITYRHRDNTPRVGGGQRPPPRRR